MNAEHVGKPVNRSRRVLVADAELYAADGRLLARGTGSFMPSRLRLEDWDPGPRD